MRIESVNLNFSPYASVNPITSLPNGNTYNNLISEAGVKGQKTAQNPSDYNPLTPSIRVNTYHMPPVIGMSERNMTIYSTASQDEVSITEETDQNSNLELIIKKIEIINNSLIKLGISGKVVTACMETVPQNYTAFYIETKNKPNIALVQFENGEYMVAETSLSSEQFFRQLDTFRDKNGFNNGKLRVDKLQDYFLEFLGPNAEKFKGSLNNSRLFHELRNR